jgi:DNA helicase-2/ATP-dependent DNA helicase PcrA
MAALKTRMQRGQIPSTAYRLATLDGFAIRLIRSFPMRSGHNPRILELEDRANDYPAIRDAAWRLMQAGHLNDVIPATYSHIIVDEYQDCNVPQHRLVSALAEILPTCVLGDPMQAIFGFGNNTLVNWALDVEPRFPSVGQLVRPWRWIRGGAEDLGNWLLAARNQLQAGQGLDLAGAPATVQWIRLNAANLQEAERQRVAAAGTPVPRDQTVLVIGKSTHAPARHQLTSQTPGATVVEAVDLMDLVDFARGFSPVAPDSLPQLAAFATSVMTGVGQAQLIARVQSIRNGRNNNPPTPIEAVAVAYANAPTLLGAVGLLRAFSGQHGARVYRPEVLRCCLTAMGIAANGAVTLADAAVQVRERNRHLGRPLSKRSVGSTLLLKGLEADVAIVLYPELMTAQNLYVALTRGARQLYVCSTGSILRPAAR